jgi:predicted nucleotidyltransferase
MVQKFFEYVVGKFEPIKSFYLKDELNPKVWPYGDEKINQSIKEDLLEISKDYFENLEIKAKLKDIVLTGSLANFNWSEYSDFDVHLIFDFGEVNKDEELVRKYLDAVEKVWKLQHDITIEGYQVEIYCQDSKQDHFSTGQYSLLKDKWLVKPTRENFVPDEDLIKRKAGQIMSIIEDLENDLKENKSYELISSKLKKVWKKIKDSRKAGLEREGEYSVENLVFKLLRRNGYIGKILDLKRKAYDKKFK